MATFNSITEEVVRMMQEKEAAKQNTPIMDDKNEYPELFSTASTGEPVARSAWSAAPAIKPSKVTDMMKMPAGEFDDTVFGRSSRQEKIATISKATSTKIEIMSQKDGSLTFTLYGKVADIEKAKKSLKTAFTHARTMEIRVPAEYHKFIVGKGGKDLNDLSRRTETKITIPKQETGSDVITIVGLKENCDAAAAAINQLYETKATQGSDTVVVPKDMRQFVFGINREGMQTIIDAAGGNVEIHAPPPSSENEEIVLRGHKTHVAVAKELILNRLQEQGKDLQSLSINNIPKNKHKFVIGPKGANIAAIYQTTGVLVTVPLIDDDTSAITMRGEGGALSRAYSMLQDFANSHLIVDVRCPNWLHKQVIGARGSKIQEVHKAYPDVQIKFVEGADTITVEGPKDSVFAVQKLLTETALTLERNMTFMEAECPSEHMRHIIGKGGQNLSRMQTEMWVNIDIPKDPNATKIRIEGPTEGVLKAKAEIDAMIKKLKDEVSLDVAIEQRFHRQIIGKSGESIKELQVKYPGVQVHFPRSDEKSDTVNIKGPSGPASECAAYLKSLGDQLAVDNHVEKVVVFSAYHKHIIGKQGANIKKIRDDTNTKIEIPSSGDTVFITGREENVKAAKEAILAIQAELANLVTKEVSVPNHMHNLIIGSGGRLVKSITEACGGVNIKFPKDKSDTVVIRGPADDVAKARHMLNELVAELAETSHTDTVSIPSAMHRHIIGRSGANIKKVKDETGCRVVFPTKDDEFADTVMIIGRKEDVKKAKEMLQTMVKEQEEVALEELTVDADGMSELRKDRSRYRLAMDIADRFRGTQLIVPKDEGSTLVVLKGPREQVPLAKDHLVTYLQKLATQVTETMQMAGDSMGPILGKGGANVRAIEEMHEVIIKLPEREQRRGNGRKESGGDASESGESSSSARNVTITGQPEAVAQAKAALQALVPITRVISIPFKLHGHIIGAGGRGIREIIDECDINVKFPSSKSNSDDVKLVGTEANVARAQQHIEELVEKVKQEAVEREKRNFSITIDIDSKHVPKIIGRGGNVINSIRDDTGCRVDLPKKDAKDQGKIVVTGFEDACQMARDRILRLIKEAEEQEQQDGDMATETLTIDPQLHGRIIGARGKQVAKLSEDLSVQIKFPKDKTSSKVVVKGAPENLEKAKDVLLDLAAEYLAEMEEEKGSAPGATYIDPKKEEKEKPVFKHSTKQVVPDISAFPAMGGDASAPPPAAPISGAWGAKR